jgi:hypothetical protein
MSLGMNYGQTNMVDSALSNLAPWERGISPMASALL